MVGIKDFEDKVGKLRGIPVWEELLVNVLEFLERKKIIFRILVIFPCIINKLFQVFGRQSQLCDKKNFLQNIHIQHHTSLPKGYGMSFGHSSYDHACNEYLRIKLVICSNNFEVHPTVPPAIMNHFTVMHINISTNHHTNLVHWCRRQLTHSNHFMVWVPDTIVLGPHAHKSLAIGRYVSNFKSINSEQMLHITFMGTSCEIALRWMTENTYQFM